MEVGQLHKLDELRERLLREYTMNGDTSEYKRIMKKVIEIGTRIAHSSLADISETPEIKKDVDKILGKIDEFNVLIEHMNTNFKVITGKVLEYMENQSLPKQQILEVEKIVYDILKCQSDKSKKNISFAFEVTKFIIYTLPVLGTLIWSVLYVQGV